MRALHLACMPFPSPQGTQAAVHAMLGALAEAGEDDALLVYGGGVGARELGYEVHRLPDLPFGRSMRSGPSLGKVALDAALVARTAALVGRLGAPLVVAHNVEAALVARAARVPYAYFAHTAMDAELPFYAPPVLGPVTAHAGAALDALACEGARAVAAISPALAAHLRRARRVEASYVPLPWTLSAPATADERGAARRALGLGSGDAVLLYAGNLDAYQGVEDVLDAAAELMERRPDARLLVATASAAAPLVRAAAARGLSPRLVVAGLEDEAARRRAHAAADVALVPRRAPGGLPIKLLDALARGVPVVATRRAASGLPLERAALLVSDDAPRSMALAAELALAPETRAELSREGRAYVARAHAAPAFVAAHRALLARATPRRRARARR